MAPPPLAGRGRCYVIVTITIIISSPVQLVRYFEEPTEGPVLKKKKGKKKKKKKAAGTDWKTG